MPVQIAVTGRFGLTPAEVSSWMFIIWFSGAISSIALSLIYRQPIPIASTIPGLLFMGALAGRYTFSELVGANLMAGVLMIVLGLLGVGRRVLRWLPMPVAMGMLAGSIFGDVSRVVSATMEDMTVAGATVAGYAVGRLIGHRRLPPVAMAMAAGGVAVLLARQAAVGPIAWELPSLEMAQMQFSVSAFLAVSVPMVVLSMGLGNVQGLGFLLAQGYRVRANRITLVLGLNSIVNALLGGHTAIVSRNGMPIMAGPEAGPIEGRYWASVISAALSLLIALAATPVVLLFGVLPSAYIVAVAGLAILPSLQNALEKAFEAKLRFGAVVAFVVSATSFSFLGIGSGVWALIAAMLALLVAEREELLTYWNARPESHVRDGRTETVDPRGLRPGGPASKAARGRPRDRSPMTRFRRARTSDQPAVRAFLSRLSPSTVLARYLSPAISVSELSHEGEVQRILDPKRSEHLVLVAVDGTEIRGVAELAVESVDRADVGFVVEDAFQGRGIGRSLFRKLARYALQRGVRAFTGDIAYGNSRALAILRGTGRSLQLEVSYGTVHFTLSLADD